jgi:hypothetical protein
VGVLKVKLSALLNVVRNDRNFEDNERTVVDLKAFFNTLYHWMTAYEYFHIYSFHGFFSLFSFFFFRIVLSLVYFQYIWVRLLCF